MKKLIDLLFLVSTLQRWNDLNTEKVGFKEIDKQGHKAFIAYLLARLTEMHENKEVDWIKLIEGLIFELVERAILTDIKPQVFDVMMKKKGKELREYVLNSFDFEDEGLNARFREHLCNKNYAKFEKKILKAAHVISSKWELDVLYESNKQTYGIEEYKSDMDERVAKISLLPAAKRLLSDEQLYKFVRLTGHMRQQKRWSKYPMEPEISICAHPFMVAITTYVSSLKMGCCTQRLINNFLTALYHDSPEETTRDISSPIKRAVKGLDELIKKLENTFLAARLDFLPVELKSEILNMTRYEFTSRIFSNEKYRKVSSELITKRYNKDEYYPVDGQLVRAWDEFLAYVEASVSYQNGTTNPKVTEICNKEYQKNKNKLFLGIDFGNLYELYKIA